MVKFKEGKLPNKLKDRIKYLYRILKLLELYHNFMGEKVSNGEITLEEFRIFQNEYVEPRRKLIIKSAVYCRVGFAEEDDGESLEDIEDEDEQ